MSKHLPQSKAMIISQVLPRLPSHFFVSLICSFKHARILIRIIKASSGEETSLVVGPCPTKRRDEDSTSVGDDNKVLLSQYLLWFRLNQIIFLT